MPDIFIGTAGWSIPKQNAASFPQAGLHLQRYGSQLNAVEINSSFYRPHRQQTYARWASDTPDNFRFSVKLPKTITHENRLTDPDALLEKFFGEVTGLGDKLAVILVQLPPSLAFDAAVATAFFQTLKSRAGCAIACEARHANWFTPEADAMLRDSTVARVAADPPRHAEDGKPGGWTGLAYYRLHGSPKIYASPYDAARLQQVAGALQSAPATQAWCMFDNTAAFAALGDALTLQTILGAAA